MELFGNCLKLPKDQRPITTVYGEIFGGYYNDLTKKPWSRVQLEVQYHPENKFMAFDIVTDDPSRDKFKLRYTNYDQCIELWERYQIPYVPVLFRGTFDEVYDKSQATNADPTTIPKLLGIDEMPNNIREGHVLKPVEPVYIGRNIVYIKDKNERFTEVRTSKKKNMSMSRYGPEEKVNYDYYEILDTAPHYITEQRFANVLSKYGSVPLDGTIEKKVLNELITLFVDDILKDVQKDVNVTLVSSDLQDIRKSISTSAFDTASKYCKWTPTKKSQTD